MGHEDVFWKVVICVALSIGRQSLVGFVGSNGPRAEFICFLKEHTENDPVCESGIYSFLLSSIDFIIKTAYHDENMS